jgi:hypothetical protein
MVMLQETVARQQRQLQETAVTCARSQRSDRLVVSRPRELAGDCGLACLQPNARNARTAGYDIWGSG